MPFHTTPRFPRGFRCAATHCGIKAEGKDLSLFVSEVPAAAAAVFTRSQVPGAPVTVGREIMLRGRLQAVVVNSRVSNVGTGEEGVARARRMGAATAEALGIGRDLVLMSSTGVIGVPLPIDKIEAGLPDLVGTLQDDPIVGAEGIMTTDTYPKAVSLPVGDATLTLVAKGSGMIEPNMATLLAYAFTDAVSDAHTLDRLLRSVVDEPVEEDAFREGITRAFTRMTELLARDGEGATTLVRVTVSGAADRREARIVAKSLVNSPLVKTMVFGGDPNVGRILMAVGKCFDCRVLPQRIAARICEAPVLESGRRTGFDDAAVRALLRQDPVDIEVDLGVGDGRARAWGCDLTHGYIDENAAYYSS
jgi:glutamate N-acetyltransferase / amino-acid N-acetyltransferase